MDFPPLLFFKPKNPTFGKSWRLLLFVLLCASPASAQLMRREHQRSAGPLQAALREALRRVTADQVLFVEERGVLGGRRVGEGWGTGLIF